VLAPQPTDVSRAVAQHAAAQSGLAPALLKKMLPILAMLVAGYMAKQPDTGTEAQPTSPQPSSAAGGLGGLLGSLLGGQAAGSGSAATPGLASMLDLDGDGNPLDDILRMVGQVIR
jgi:hypothetical protein